MLLAPWKYAPTLSGTFVRRPACDWRILIGSGVFTLQLKSHLIRLNTVVRISSLEIDQLPLDTRSWTIFDMTARLELLIN